MPKVLGQNQRALVLEIPGTSGFLAGEESYGRGRTKLTRLRCTWNRREARPKAATVNRLSARPVSHMQTGHAGKLTRVVGNQDCAQTQGMGGNQRIQRPDGLALFLQRRAQGTADTSRGFIESGDCKIQKKVFQQFGVGLV